MAVIDTPLQEPPAGVLSNYDNPTFLGMPIIIVAGISIPLILILACMRLYARAIVLRKWRLEDCVWAVTCILGLVFIAFSLPFILCKPTGFHAWDINIEEISKASLLRLHAFLLAYGPMLWFVKLSLFCFLFKYFRSTRWLRNTVYVGIIVTGLVFSAYTIVVATACGPRPNSDTKSYLNGLQSTNCSSSNGVHAIASGLTNIVNFLTNLILIALPMPLIKTLNLTAMERRGIYGILFVGGLAALSSMVTIIYRFKLWKSNDFTGSLIPLNVSILIEVALSLIIPCLPSFGTLYDHITYIDINDKTIIGASKAFPVDAKPPISPPLTPPSATQPSWRRVNLNIEDLPYREKSPSNSEFTKSHTTVNSISTVASAESRMKALPCTPLPFSMPTSPKTPVPEMPKSPISVRSMQLPIVYSPTRIEYASVTHTPLL